MNSISRRTFIGTTAGAMSAGSIASLSVAGLTSTSARAETTPKPNKPKDIRVGMLTAPLSRAGSFSACEFMAVRYRAACGGYLGQSGAHGLLLALAHAGAAPHQGQAAREAGLLQHRGPRDESAQAVPDHVRRLPRADGADHSHQIIGHLRDRVGDLAVMQAELAGVVIGPAAEPGLGQQ